MGDIRCLRNKDMESLRAGKPSAASAESGSANRRGSVGKVSH